MTTIEDRLRRTYEAVAQRTTVSDVELPLASAPAVPRKQRRTIRLLSVAAAVVAVAGAGAVVATTRSHRSVHVRTSDVTTLASTSTVASATTVPSAVTGDEQVIRAAAIPSEIAASHPGPFQWHPVEGTSPEGFTVDGTTPFVLSDLVPSRGMPELREPSACTFYAGTLAIGGQGYGTEVGCTALADVDSGAKRAIQRFPQFPTAEQDTVVWAHLPDATAFVTFESADGTVKRWERPLHGAVAFIVPTSYSGTHPFDFSAPKPVMRAYDANGGLLARVAGPRFLGDFTTG